MIPIILISHGNIAGELLKSAEMILGPQHDVWTIEISASAAIDVMREKLESLLLAINEETKSGQCPCLILTDMPGGSPCNICLPLLKKYDVTIISGMNLYMLVSALKNRNDLAFEELKKKIIADAAKSITDVCSILKHEH